MMRKSRRLAKGAIAYVMEHHHDVIKVYITENDTQSIAFYIETKKYDTLLYLYGHQILLGMLEYFVTIEEYEICKCIVDGIKKFNKETNSKVPLKL